MAQIASPGRQPPPNASATGTDTPAASAAKPISAVLYIPVTRPTRSGKFAAHQHRQQHVPDRDRGAGDRGADEQEAEPRQQPDEQARAGAAASAPATVGRAPNRRASAGASGASAPKHRTGSVTSTSAPASDRPVSDWIRSISGPMPAAAGRRFAATSTMPDRQQHRRPRPRTRGRRFNRPSSADRRAPRRRATRRHGGRAARRPGRPGPGMSRLTSYPICVCA